MAVTRRLESRLRSLNLIVTFVVIYFNMWRFLKQWKQHSHSPEILKMWCAFSVLSILTENFVQILILLNEIKIVKIWPQFFISQVILKLHKKGRPHFGNAWISGVLWLLTIYFILLLKLDWQIKHQIISNPKDDLQVVLLLSCFVGHPVYIKLN